jgi:cytoskeletal protein RodZ
MEDQPTATQEGVNNNESSANSSKVSSPSSCGIVVIVLVGLIGVFLMVSAVHQCAATKKPKKTTSGIVVPTTIPKKTVEQDLEDATTTSDSPSTE